MMVFPYTSLFAASYLLLFVALTIQVIHHRRRHRIPLGNPTQDEMLERKIRVQGNFAETTPLLLIALLLLESAGFHYLIMALGLLHLLGRMCHAYGLLEAEPKRRNFTYRTMAMVMTLSGMGMAALVLLAKLFGLTG